MEIVNKFKPFHLSPITKQIEEYLKVMSEGESVSYLDLKDLTGFECDSANIGYRYLRSALRRLAMRNHHFANIPGLGYRKLNPNETVAEKEIKHGNLGRQIKRHSNELQTIDVNRLGTIETMEFKAIVFVGRATARLLSSRIKSKLIEEIKKQPVRELDYEKLTDIYLRKKKCTA